MELQHYLRILKSYWRSIAAVTLVCIAAAAGLTLLQSPTYQASSAIFVSVDSGGTAGELSQGATYAERTVSSYVRVATSDAVLDPVIEELQLDMTSGQLASKLSVSSPSSTSIINIRVTDGSPERSAQLATAVSDHLVEAVYELSPAGTDGTRLVTATVIDNATTPTSAASPQPTRNLALGLLLGLLLGAGQTLLRSVLDTRVRTVEDLEQISDAPVLASIGHRSEQHPDADWVSEEAYRRLRTNIGFLGLGGERRPSFVITSAMENEGKTETAINLAKVLAQAGESVILVDADLRSPSVANRLGLDSELGLTDALTGRGSLDDLIIEVVPGYLSVLPAGSIPPNPSELLGSDAMARLLKGLESRYDYVLFDTAPLLPVTDTVVLSSQTSGAVVVARSSQIRRPQIEGAIRLLEAGEAPVLGLVLNDVPQEDLGAYGKYYGSYYGRRATPASN